MSLDCEAWGLGPDFDPARECVKTPYESTVAKERWIWFVVTDQEQIRGTIKFARCTWRCSEAYTSDDPTYGPSALQPGCIDRPLEPAWWLVYERVTDYPKCTKFS